ncbi:hypothetical protein VPH35_032564 [Triticum aestivum]
MTYLFTVPEYSKWARTPARIALNFDPFFVCGQLHHLKVYPAGFDEELAEFVAVFLIARHGPFDQVYNTNEGLCRLRISIEILDESGERTVFDNYTASELECSSCIRRHDDSFTLRCTVFVNVEVEVRKMPAKVSKPEAGTISASYAMTIGFFSNRKFSFGGGSWYLKVFPNGYCDASMDWVSTETMAEFRFEVIGVMGAVEGEMLRHMFDHDNLAHGSQCLVESGDLTQTEHMATDNDRLVIRCHLQLIKTTTARLPPTTEPPTAITVPPSDGLKHISRCPARLTKSWEKGWMKRRGMQLHC